MVDWVKRSHRVISISCRMDGCQGRTRAGYWGRKGANACRAAVIPVNHCLPSWRAKERRLGTEPAARRNLEWKRETVSFHAWGFAPMRRRIEARWCNLWTSQDLRCEKSRLVRG